ncbi:aldehyde dehydrogenase family protein [Pseudonocardia nigra]|uniref:aldehyde dehydrogenase family protein n=1 Tax=Pseudonocardia nigra TaxID=1921578 RepID=UPI001C605FDF|nr:aldehyde dehydrogenase family protein [Pseudonocardia nigra]
MRLPVTAPHDRSVIGEIEADDEAAIDAKVEAAAAAMTKWAATSPMARAETLLRIVEAMRPEVPRLAQALSLEQGKTMKEATLELERSIGPYVQYAGLAMNIGGRHVALGDGVEGVVEREPVGVVVGVVPWNFPVSLFVSKLAPALAAGCAFLIKPAETTSLITRELAAIAQRFLPPGLLDVVVGGPEVGSYLVSHPGIARVTFTGSTPVGQAIAATAGVALKRLSLELGGCDPFVVLDDADLTRAVRSLMGTRFYNAGQVCVAPKRLIVHDAVADKMIDMVTQRMARIRVGPGQAPDSTMGPLHTEAARQRLEEQVADALDHGAEIVGGGRPDRADTERGSFVQPALLLAPPESARVRTEETFGPVLTVLRVGSDDEAVRISNQTPYGLGASVWSADRDRALSVARQIAAGYTWVNALGRVYDELPFGGVKASGFGREHGVEVLESYLEDHTYVIGPGTSAPIDRAQAAPPLAEPGSDVPDSIAGRNP